MSLDTRSRTYELELPADTWCADTGCSAPPLEDPAAAVAAAVAQPLNFPPLRQATIPGDRVAIAVGSGVPRLPEVLAGLIHSLREGPHADPEVTVLQVAGSGERALSLLPETVRDQTRLVFHDPHDREGLSYVAAARDGSPIYLNRELVDADVVLPLGCLRVDGGLGALGPHDTLFPTFSDAATQMRFAAPSVAEWRQHQRRRRAEAEEAGWLLGVQFTIQLIPGNGDSVVRVLAGDSEAVTQQGQELCRALWTFDPPSDADLVIATLEDDGLPQTWDHVAQALATAGQVVHPGGSIVLCSQLAQAPGPALAELQLLDEEQALRRIRKHRSPDAQAARVLLEIQRDSRVYLLSRLEREVVEDLGVGFVEDAAEIGQLCRRHRRCALLPNAHRATARIAVSP